VLQSVCTPWSNTLFWVTDIKILFSYSCCWCVKF